MQTIVIVMRRKPIAQAFIQKLENYSDIKIVHETDYALAGGTILVHNAVAALIEVGETSDIDIEQCLVLCDRIQSRTPSCKLLLMCPEQSETSVLAAVRAKKDGRIDDFVFYDVSLDYLASKLLSML